MCFLYFIVIGYLGFSALALWLLPQWLSIPLVAIMGVVLAIVMWKIVHFFKKVKKAVGGFIPQEKLCSLAAGEPFNGHGFTFTFPMACEVSQTRFREVEALILKPKFDFPNAPKNTLMVVSTFPPEELKPKINDSIEKIFAQVEGRAGELEPVEVGPLKGERSTFATAKDGKDVRGEAVSLGDGRCSIIWIAIAEASTFDALSAKYRELAVLIQRVETAQPPPPNTQAP